MAEDMLDDDYDVIVLGTGLPEAIVAAACSRSGLSVLHLDRNDYYGNVWSSFHLRAMEEWVQSQQTPSLADPFQDVQGLLNPGETAVLIPPYRTSIDNVQSEWHVQMAASKEENEMNVDNDGTEVVIGDQPVTTATQFETTGVESAETVVTESKETLMTEVQSKVDADVEEKVQLETETEVGVKSGTEAKREIEGDVNTSETSGEQETTAGDASADGAEGQESVSKVWTRDALDNQWRRFNLDLAPKVLRGRGPMVGTLCQSEVSRYAEFKCVDRFVCLSADGCLHRVPCSRSEIFQTDAISKLDKRKLMKFLTFAIDWQNQPQQYQDFAEKPFREFLEAKGLTGLLQTYVAETISILERNPSTLQGLGAISKFLTSVGRFGNSPFLWTVYGSGELPQCFCRLCAVFGGTYCLRRPIHAFILDQNNRCSGVVTGGQRISCRHVIAHTDYLPSEFCIQRPIPANVQRAILISDRSLLQQSNHITLLNLVKDDVQSGVCLLEAGFNACIAPKGLFVSHLMGTGASPSKDTLRSIVAKHFTTTEEDDEEILDEQRTLRPRVLWSVYFDICDRLQTTDTLPDNVGIVTGPDASLDYESTVQQAQNLFERFWPDRDFLPRVLHREEDPENEEAEEQAEKAIQEALRSETVHTQEDNMGQEKDKTGQTQCPGEAEDRQEAEEAELEVGERVSNDQSMEHPQSPPVKDKRDT